MVKLREVKTFRLLGVSAFAKELEVTPEHVKLVYRGKRRSPRIEAALLAQGIKCKRHRQARD